MALRNNVDVAIVFFPFILVKYFPHGHMRDSSSSMCYSKDWVQIGRLVSNGITQLSDGWPERLSSYQDCLMLSSESMVRDIEYSYWNA